MEAVQWNDHYRIAMRNAKCSVKNIFVLRCFLFVFPGMEVNRKNDVLLPAFAEKVSCF